MGTLWKSELASDMAASHWLGHNGCHSGSAQPVMQFFQLFSVPRLLMSIHVTSEGLMLSERPAAEFALERLILLLLRRFKRAAAAAATEHRHRHLHGFA